MRTLLTFCVIAALSLPVCGQTVLWNAATQGTLNSAEPGPALTIHPVGTTALGTNLVESTGTIQGNGAGFYFTNDSFSFVIPTAETLTDLQLTLSGNYPVAAQISIFDTATGALDGTGDLSTPGGVTYSGAGTYDLSLPELPLGAGTYSVSLNTATTLTSGYCLGGQQGTLDYTLAIQTAAVAEPRSLYLSLMAGGILAWLGLRRGLGQRRV
jgi:hypothetical protein